LLVIIWEKLFALLNNKIDMRLKGIKLFRENAQQMHILENIGGSIKGLLSRD
jgi:hypothetical protein